jgi:GT2 family glycosyltransferase
MLQPPASRVTAVIVSYDSAGVLPACLQALAREGVKAVVVDNASTDESFALATAHGATLLRNAANEGYGRANNRGVAACDTPYSLIINPDCEVQPGAIAALLAAAERYPEAAMLAPRIVEPSGRLFLQMRSLLSPPHLNHGRASAVPQGDACLPFLSGACLLVRRDLFLEIGGFDPEIFLFYEDDDLCRRMRDAGYGLVHVHEAEALHGRGQSSPPSAARRFKARWHLAWSERHVAAKYGLPMPSPLKIIANLAKAAGYAVLLNRMKASAHAGSVAGAVSAMRGRSALAREGIAT